MSSATKSVVESAVADLQTNKITLINLSSKQLDDSDAKQIANALKANQSLEKLVLESNNIGPDGAKAIADALKVNKSLQRLDLHNNDIGVQGSKAIAEALKQSNSLLALDVGSNDIKNEGAAAIAEGLKVNDSLQILLLYNNSTKDEGCRAIADALKVNSSLTCLQLHVNSIGSDGAAAIADVLKGKTSLKFLVLSNNCIGDDGARAVAEALKVNKSLQSLDLPSNDIGVQGSKAIAEALKINKSLHELDLGLNSIGVRGAEAIADALQINHILQHLYGVDGIDDNSNECLQRNRGLLQAGTSKQVAEQKAKEEEEAQLKEQHNQLQLAQETKNAELQKKKIEEALRKAELNQFETLVKSDLRQWSSTQVTLWFKHYFDSKLSNDAMVKVLDSITKEQIDGRLLAAVDGDGLRDLGVDKALDRTRVLTGIKDQLNTAQSHTPIDKPSDGFKNQNQPSLVSTPESKANIQSDRVRFLDDTGSDALTVMNPLTGVADTPLLDLQAAIIFLVKNLDRSFEHPCINQVDQLQGPVFVPLALFFAKKNVTISKKNPHGLSVDEIAAIHLYTQESPVYKLLNACLADRDRERIQPFLPYLKLLLSALYKLPLVSRTLYRGVKRDILSKYIQDEDVTWWPFSSTTKSMENIENFLGMQGHRTMFTIDVKTGVDISPYSAIPDEEEILVLPGSYFVVREAGMLKQQKLAMIRLQQIQPPPVLDFTHPQLLSAFQ